MVKKITIISLVCIILFLVILASCKQQEVLLEGSSLSRNVEACIDENVDEIDTSDLEKHFSELFGKDIILIPYSDNSITQTIDDETTYHAAWIDGNFAYALSYYNEDRNIYIVNIGELSVNNYELPIKMGNIKSSRVINDKILVITSSGFYTISFNGKIDEIFNYEKEEIKYNWNLQLLGNSFVNNSVIISDDFKYVSFYTPVVDDLNQSQEVQTGSWNLVVLNIKDETESILLNGIWSSDLEDYSIVKEPVAFSSDAKYLYINQNSLNGLFLPEFSGRINLSTKEVDEFSANNSNIEKIVNNDSIVLFKHASPSGEITSIYSYNFQTATNTEFNLVNFDLLDTDIIYLYRANGDYNILNYNTNQYSVFFQNEDNKGDILNFQDINDNSEIIGFFRDENGVPTFSLLKLTV